MYVRSINPLMKKKFEKYSAHNRDSLTGNYKIKFSLFTGKKNYSYNHSLKSKTKYK